MKRNLVIFYGTLTFFFLMVTQLLLDNPVRNLSDNEIFTVKEKKLKQRGENHPQAVKENAKVWKNKNSSHLNIPLALVVCSDKKIKQQFRNISDIKEGDKLQQWARTYQRQHEQIKVLLGSMLLMSELPSIKLYIVTDYDNIYEDVVKIIERWPTWQRNRLKLQKVKLAMPKNEFFDFWRPCAWGRWFLENMLDEDAVLYLDTDILFLGPVEDIIQKIESMNKNQVVGLGNEAWYSHESRKDSDRSSFKFASKWGLSTGLLLLNLTRSRKLEQEIGNGLGYALVDVVLHMDEENASLIRHDQDIANFYFLKYPERYAEISPRFLFNMATCILNVPCQECVDEGIVALHGAAATFYFGDGPRIRGVYELFSTVTDSLTVDRRTLLGFLQKEALKFYPMDVCQWYQHFSHMLLAHLENKLTRS